MFIYAGVERKTNEPAKGCWLKWPLGNNVKFLCPQLNSVSINLFHSSAMHETLHCANSPSQSAAFCFWQVMCLQQRLEARLTGDSFGSYRSKTLPWKCVKCLKTDTSYISQPHFQCINNIFRLLGFSCALQRSVYLFTHYPLAVLAEIIVPFSRFQAGYIRIDGSVPSSERIQLVHKFQNDPETRVAVLSIQAAGQVVNQNKNNNDWSSVTHNVQRFGVQKNI